MVGLYNPSPLDNLEVLNINTTIMNLVFLIVVVEVLANADSERNTVPPFNVELAIIDFQFLTFSVSRFELKAPLVHL